MNFKSIIFITVLQYFFTESTFAQNIKAFICKNAIDSSLINDQITIINNKSKTIQKTKGPSITLNLDSLMFLKIFIEKYELLIPSQNPNQQILFFIPLSIATSDIVISANKIMQDIKTTTVSMESIKPYLWNNKGIQNPLHLMDQIPGIQTIDGQVIIRGGSGWSYGAGSRVSVLVDGLPLMSGDANQVQWTFLPIDNVQNIEIIKGASSVLFGSSALNGIVNFRTQDPFGKAKLSYTVFSNIYDKAVPKSLQWSNNPLLNNGIRGYYSNHKNRFAYNLIWFANNDNGYRMGESEQKIRLGGLLKYRFKNLKHSFSLQSHYLYGKNSSFLLWESYDLAYTALDSNYNENISCKLMLDPCLELKYKHSEYKIMGRYLKINNQVGINQVNNNQNNASDLYYLDQQLSKKWNPNLSTVLGLMNSYTISKSPLYQGNQNSSNVAMYLQSKYSISNTNIEAGIRYEFYTLNKKKESKPVLRIGINQKIKKYSFLRASFGQGYRFPTIAESFIKTSVGPVKIYANENLKSEQGWNAEIGIKQALKYKNIKGLLDIAAYQMEYQNMMEFTFSQWSSDISAANLYGFGFKSVNVSKAIIKGIEFSANGMFNFKKHTFTSIFGYNFINPINPNPNYVFITDPVGRAINFKKTSSDTLGNYLKYRSKHLFKIDLQYEINNIEIGISMRYNSYMLNVDKAFVDFPIAIFVPGVSQGRDMSKKGNFIYDFRMAYQLKNYKFSFAINNITNHIYMTRPADMRAPRMFLFQLQYNWNKQ